MNEILEFIIGCLLVLFGGLALFILLEINIAFSLLMLFLGITLMLDSDNKRLRKELT